MPDIVIIAYTPTIFYLTIIGYGTLYVIHGYEKDATELHEMAVKIMKTD